MPYQGSAQSVGFRQRAVIDPSRRMRQEAEQIERQGQQRIRGMERQASQQIEEMRRVSDIQDSNARYELGVLADLSPTIQKSIWTRNDALWDALTERITIASQGIDQHFRTVLKSCTLLAIVVQYCRHDLYQLPNHTHLDRI